MPRISQLYPYSLQRYWTSKFENITALCLLLENGQFGFMPGRVTTDAIFAVRQLMAKHLENIKDCIIIMVFIELEKAYDRMPRQ